MSKRLLFSSPPYEVLWRSAISFLLAGILMFDKSTIVPTVIDLNFRDTYLVLNIHMLNVGLSFSTIASLLGLAYWLLRHLPLTPWMSATHAWASVISLIIMLSVLSIQSSQGLFDHPIFSYMNVAAATAFFIFVAAQLLLSFNLVYSLARRTVQSTA